MSPVFLNCVSGFSGNRFVFSAKCLFSFANVLDIISLGINDVTRLVVHELLCCVVRLEAKGANFCFSVLNCVSGFAGNQRSQDISAKWQPAQKLLIDVARYAVN